MWLIPLGLLGQQKDFQTWWEFSLDKGLNNGIDLSGEIEQRFRNNSLNYDRSLVTVSAEYDLMEYLNVAAGMRALLTNSREQMLNARYRLQADAMSRVSLLGVDISFRTRLQYGFDDLILNEDYSQNSLNNRNRLKVAYHIFGTRLDCFASVESWHQIGDRPNQHMKKVRYSAGTRFMVNFRSSLSVRYIMEDEIHVRNPMQSYILVFGYEYDL